MIIKNEKWENYKVYFRCDNSINESYTDIFAKNKEDAKKKFINFMQKQNLKFWNLRVTE